MVRAVHEDVLGLFKQMIRDGQCRPGQRLPNERDLARRLGVSRPALRESLRALAAMNILEVRPGDGTSVSSLDPGLLAEPLQLILAFDDSVLYALFEVRRVIEPAAAAFAAERATTDELGLLRTEMAKGAASERDPLALIAHDTALHRLVHRAAHNPLLMSTSASLAGLAHTARLRTVRLPKNARLTIEEHSAFVEAICSRCPDEASAAMLRHLRRIEEHLRVSEGAACS